MNHLRKSLVYALCAALSAGFLPIHVYAEETETVISEADEPHETYGQKISEHPQKTEEDYRIIGKAAKEKEPADMQPMVLPDVSDAENISLNTDTAVYIVTQGQMSCYRFTPSETAWYTLSSDAPGPEDTIAYLYAADGSLLYTDDDGGRDMNFRMVYQLNKGTTYYFGVGFYHESDTGSFTIRLIKGGAHFWASGDGYVTVSPGASVSLQVSGRGDTSKATYQWYREDTLLSGEKNSVIDLSNITQSASYRCHCNDGYGFETDIYFYVSVENHFSVERIGGYYREVSYNSPLTMEITITADDKTGMKIEWYEMVFDESRGIEEERLIAGASGTSYTIPKVTHTAAYTAVVTDRYNNQRGIDFYIVIPNNLSAEWVGEPEQKVKYQGDITLSVRVSANDKTGIKYSWYAFDPLASYEDAYTKLDDSASLTLKNVRNNVMIACVVSDRYGNRHYIYYQVTIDNQLSASVIGGEIISVIMYGAAYISLEVNALDKTGITYEWYRGEFNYDVEDFVYTLLARNTSPDYTLANIQKSSPMYVRVTDRFGNYVDVKFNINIIEDYQISIRKDFLYLETGKSETLIADGEPHKNWSSLDPSVAAVDQSGKVTVKKVGWTMIYCFDDEHVYGDSCYVRGMFSDVKTPSAYYFDPVYWAFDNNITTGTGSTTFSPNDKCSRAQIVTFLWRLKGSPKVASPISFKDVTKDKYYYDAVAWAASSGITTGTTAATFSPNDTCTRGQIVTFLYRAMGEPDPGWGAEFADVSSDKYYYNAVSWAANNGITTGTSETTFSPGDKCSRAQAVTFLYRTATLPG